MKVRIVKRTGFYGKEFYVVERLRDFVLFKLWVNAFPCWYASCFGYTFFDRTFNTLEEAEKGVKEFEAEIKGDVVMREYELTPKIGDQDGI